MDWKEETTLNFIDDYRSHEILWQPSHVNYNNRIKRRDAISQLGDKYGLDARSVLNKIKSLRSYIHREHAKLMKKKSEAEADAELITSNWFAYKHLSFILDDDGEETREEETQTNISQVTDAKPSQEKVNPGFSKRFHRRKKLRISYEPTNKVPTTLRNVGEKFEKEDHFSIFSKYLASRMKRLDDPLLQNMAEQRINEVMCEIENMSRPNLQNTPNL